MARFQFDLASQEDDVQLRQLLARNRMPGPISLGFRREPSFFDAASIDGDFRQTIVCRDTESCTIVGLGTRSVRDRYFHGRLTRIGYLSSLRLDAAVRGRGLVARGFQFLRELDRDQRAKFYVTTIADGNESALQTLVGARAGLPHYVRIATWVTYSISLQRCRWPGLSGLRVRSAVDEDVPQIVEFLNATGSKNNLFPRYSEQDLLTPQGALRGLDLSRLYVAWNSQQIVGTLALWDQSAFKQVVVEGYTRWLHFARPAFNAWSRLRGDPLLPKPGQTLSNMVGSLVLILDDQLDIFKSLISYAAREHADAPLRLLLGFDACSPVSSLIASRASHSYATGVYLVSWNLQPEDLVSADGRLYLELGCL